MALTLGERLRDARKAAGLTQEKLAQEADVTVSTIARLEHDRTEPSLGTLFALARVLDVSVTALLPDQVAS